jgi:hypothetical protein
VELLVMPGRDLKLTIVLISMLTCIAACCGYEFSGEGEGPKPGLRCIAIPVFENKTTEPDAGAIFAGALRQEFIRKGNMQVVPVEGAQAVFRGTVKTIRIASVAHNPVEVASQRVTVENRLFITLDIRCEEKESRKVLWRDPNFTYSTVYATSLNPLQPDPVLDFDYRRAAVNTLAQDMAIRIHDRFLSNF